MMCMTNGMTRSRSMCTPSALGGGLASLDLISRMLRKETPAVRFAAVHRYDEPMTIMLVPLTEAERPALIADFQESFEHFQGNPQGSFVGERLAAREQSPAGPSEGSATAQPILPLSDIEESLNAPGALAYRILEDGNVVGNVILTVAGHRGEVLLFAMKASVHSRGVGTRAWFAIEAAHPQVREWTLVTPYFEVHNIHFYVNKCGFHIVEFFNEHHSDTSHPRGAGEPMGEADYMFRFVKRLGR